MRSDSPNVRAPGRLRRRVGIAAACLVACAIVGAGTWATWRWMTYPDVPDVRSAQLDQVIGFMGTDDFNRMIERHRIEYALGVVDRLRGKSFEEILLLMMKQDPRRQHIAANMRATPGNEKVTSAMLGMFFDKFYELSGPKKTLYLTTIALAQQGEIGKHPERFGLPPPNQFQGDLKGFMSRQPVRVQAQMGQFLIDLKKHRERMGLKEPF